MIWGWLRGRSRASNGRQSGPAGDAARGIVIDAVADPAMPEPPACDKPRRDRPDIGAVGADLMIEGVNGRRLDYPEAARTFVVWLIQHGETGEIPRDRLKALYARHCGDLGLAWLPENLFFGALADLATKHERRVPMASGRRRRTTTYGIPTAMPDMTANTLRRVG